MCTAARGCTNLKLVPMLFAPYLGTNINTTFQNSRILFFHRTLIGSGVARFLMTAEYATYRYLPCVVNVMNNKIKLVSHGAPGSSNNTIICIY